jgi:glucokinase
MDTAIGIDVGGTKIQGVVITRTGRVVKQVKIATKAQGKKESIIADIVGLIKLLSSKNVVGIGIGFPSVADIEKGEILNTANIKSLRNVNIVQTVRDFIKKPVHIENDANCFAIAEHMFGAGKGRKDVVGITLGTGIGSGVIIDKKILHGAHYSAGEIGHIIIEPDGRRGYGTICGEFEQYASGRGIEKTYQIILEREKKAVLKLDAYNIFELASEGDPAASEAVDRTYKYLAAGLSVVANLLDPELIIVGGGLANKFDYKRLNKLVKKNTYFSKTKILKSKLSKLAPAIGAGALAFAEK